MKDYKQLLKELPSSTIVCAAGEFDPPTVAHEMLVKTVKRLAEEKNSAHVIFTHPSKNSILQEDKKSQYLSLMFPKTNFNNLSESFSASVADLKKKYKNVIVVAGSDQMNSLKRGLKESVQFVAITEKDPDTNETKMKSLASKALFEEFKKKLPTSIRELDSKRLMNDVRQGMGLEPIKEQLNLVKDELREQYFRGEIFNVGELVESSGQQFEIVKRGSNHLLLKDQSGELVSKWITDVKQIQEAVVQPNGTDKIDTNAPESSGNNQVQKPKGKVKGFLTFYNYDDKTKNVNESALNKNDPHGDYQAKRKALQDIQMDPHTHKDPKLKDELIYRKAALEKEYDKYRVKEETELLEYEISHDGNGNYRDDEGNEWSSKSKNAPRGSFARRHTITSNEPHAVHINGKKWKTFGSQSHAQNVANKIKGATVHKEEFNEETEEQRKDREKQLKRFADQVANQDRPGMSTETKPFNDPFFKEELTDEQIDEMVTTVSDDDILDLYEVSELSLIYEDTGEEIPESPEEAAIDLMEVLSRQERMKAKIRFRRSQAKRDRSTRIALKRYSPVGTINKRARRLAVKLMKQRLLRGRNYQQTSVGEKERIDQIIAKRKSVIDRIAAKLVSRIRRTEKSRMSHGNVTKGDMPNVL